MKLRSKSLNSGVFNKKEYRALKELDHKKYLKQRDILLIINLIELVIICALLLN